MPTLEEIEDKITDLGNELEELKHEVGSMQSKEGKFWGRAFIIFDSQIEAEHAGKLKLIYQNRIMICIAKKFKLKLINRLFNWIWYRLLKCKKPADSKLRLNGKRIRMFRAPEPSDIYWQNIPISSNQKIWRILLTYFVMVVILGVAFGIYLGIGIAKNEIENSVQTNDNISNPIGILLSTLITVINSLLVSIVSLILEFVIKELSNRELQASHTSINLTIAIKLVFALFINVGVTPLFVNFSTQKWFNRSGLIQDILFNTASICFLSPIIYFFKLRYIIFKWIIYREKSKEWSYYTQRKMNELHEGRILSVSYLYATSIVLLMISAFYVTLLPYISLVCFFGALFQYWFQKFTIIRYYK